MLINSCNLQSKKAAWESVTASSLVIKKLQLSQKREAQKDPGLHSYIMLAL